MTRDFIPTIPAQGNATISLAQIAYAIGVYYKGNRQLRLGQFMVNTFMTPDTLWPELFYEGDDEKAAKIFFLYLEYLENSHLAG